VYVGRIDQSQKGVFYLPDILRGCIDRGIDVTLSVAGDGPDLDELRGRLASSGVLDIVEFIGRVPETAVHDVMMDHHVLVLPAFYEGFGKVVAEAMSCGCVPVSSRVSGPDEYVEHGRTGFLAEVGAVDEFVDSIGRLFGDQQLWESMSQAARCSAEQTFGMKVSGSRYVGLIRDALDGRYPLAQPRTKLAGVDLSQFSKGDYFPRWIRRPIARLRCRLFKQKSGAGR
jgi:glycosyltransferase involved in cell wall biosynthesis